MKLVFEIIIAILSSMGMYFLAFEIDKRQKLDNYTAICVGGIACCSLLLGLMLGVIFF